MATVDGSLTFFRGDPSVTTEKQEVVSQFMLKAGQTVYNGQVLVFDADVNQQTTPVAGAGATGTSNGIVRAFTTGDSYQTKSGLAGICLMDVDDSDTTDAQYGVRVVSVLWKGTALVRAIVNATGTGDGYEIPIKRGSPAAFGGGVGGGTITGSNTVSGFTTATAGAFFFNNTSPTDGASNINIGWFLDYQDGHATDQTVSNATVTAAANQSPETWLRIYVDMGACFSGTIVKYCN